MGRATRSTIKRNCYAKKYSKNLKPATIIAKNEENTNCRERIILNGKQLTFHPYENCGAQKLQ